MQVFKTFFKIAKKHVASCLVYLGVFVALLLMMSHSSSDTSTSFEEASLNISIIDEDNSTASIALAEYLTSTHKLVSLPSTDRETLQDSLYYAKIDYVLRIPSGFEKKLTQGATKEIVKSSKRQDSADGYFLDEQVEQYLQTISLYLKGGFSLTEAIQKTEASLADTPEVTILNKAEETNAKAGNFYQFFQYIPYMLLSMLIVGMAPIVIIFQQKDLENRIHCSALSVNKINMQLSLSCLVYSILVWVVFMLAAFFSYGGELLFSHDGLLCVLNSFVYLLISIAITLFITIFSPNDNILNMLANVIGLGMSFLCGIFVPQYLLSENVISIARFLPAYWYVRINNMLSGASGEGYSFENYVMWIGIECLFCVALFVLYLVGSKQKKLER